MGVKVSPLRWYTNVMYWTLQILNTTLRRKKVQNTTCRKFFAAYYEKQQSDSSLDQSTEEVHHWNILNHQILNNFIWVLSINNAIMLYASCNFNVIFLNNVLMYILIICKRNYE
jgi:hypothetical protein